MGRKPKEKLYVKQNLTISLPLWMIIELKKIKGYNPLIEKLILEHLKKSQE